MLASRYVASADGEIEQWNVNELTSMRIKTVEVHLLRSLFDHCRLNYFHCFDSNSTSCTPHSDSFPLLLLPEPKNAS